VFNVDPAERGIEGEDCLMGRRDVVEFRFHV